MSFHVLVHIFNPTPTFQDLSMDPTLESHKRALIVDTLRQLKASKMVSFLEDSGNLFVTELGRVASHYYIRCGGYDTGVGGMTPGDALATLGR